LDFTISDQNSCSLLSLPDEKERVLGHRLLRHWTILRELRQANATERLPMNGLWVVCVG
jgi:hypothetical protein